MTHLIHVNWPTATDVARSVVGVSVCVSCAKTAELIEVRYGG